MNKLLRTILLGMALITISMGTLQAQAAGGVGPGAKPPGSTTPPPKKKPDTTTTKPPRRPNTDGGCQPNCNPPQGSTDTAKGNGTKKP
jgi:hypothetical protein